MKKGDICYFSFVSHYLLYSHPDLEVDNYVILAKLEVLNHNTAKVIKNYFSKGKSGYNIFQILPYDYYSDTFDEAKRRLIINCFVDPSLKEIESN